jgi:hypothetical protein
LRRSKTVLRLARDNHSNSEISALSSKKPPIWFFWEVACPFSEQSNDVAHPPRRLTQSLSMFAFFVLRGFKLLQFEFQIKIPVKEIFRKSHRLVVQVAIFYFSLQQKILNNCRHPVKNVDDLQ